MGVAVLIAILAALLAPLVHRMLGERAAPVLALVPAGLLVYFLARIPLVSEQGLVLEVIPWVPSFGVNLGFALDGLSLLFAILITGFGALITAYSGDYLKGDEHRGRFLLFLLLFMASMLGLVLADDILLLFVFWEMTSFSSYLLIGYKHAYENSRKSALQALLVTSGGGLALMAGLLILSIASGGTFSLAEISESGPLIQASALYAPALILIVIGAFSKSAQVPLHFWLPNAMAAPSPVSAYLHSATMVKAGVYLLARLFQPMAGTDLWLYTLAVFGGVTMVTGAVLALRRTDLKRILAYSTITALGTLVMLLGLSYALAIQAMIVFLLVHALYKASLFLVAGSISHATGSLDVRELGGLRHRMPWTYGAAIVAALSMSGLPPLFGFIGKEVIYESALGFEGGAMLVVIAAVTANALTVVAAGIVALRPFHGAVTPATEQVREVSPLMVIGPVVLALAGLVLGVIPWLGGVLPFGPDTLVGPALAAVLGTDPGLVIQAWHGVNMALILSVITVALGVVGYLKWDAIRGFLTRLDPILSRGPEWGYERVFDSTLAFAGWQTRVIQNGNLRHYMIRLIVTTFGLIGVTFVLKVGQITVPTPDVQLPELIVFALMATGALVVAMSRVRILALGGLGMAGFGAALMFIIFGAPDLAMTQLLVETLLVVVIVLVMRRLPEFGPRMQSRGAHVRDIVIAASFGIVMCVFMLSLLSVPFDTTLQDFYAAQSVPQAHGHNIVNVILVDFRALDTLGEITVLGIAGLGALVLLAVRRAGAPSDTEVP